MKRNVLSAVMTISAATMLLAGCSEESESEPKEKAPVEQVNEGAEAEPAPVIDYTLVTNENVEKALNVDNLESVELSDEGDGTYFATVRMAATGTIISTNKHALNAFQALFKFETIHMARLIYESTENSGPGLIVSMSRDQIELDKNYDSTDLQKLTDAYVVMP